VKQWNRHEEVFVNELKENWFTLEIIFAEKKRKKNRELKNMETRKR